MSYEHIVLDALASHCQTFKDDGQKSKLLPFIKSVWKQIINE